MGKRLKKLLDQVRDTIQLKHYSIRTEEAYVRWIKRYILLHHKRHLKDIDVPEIEAFLTHLAVEQHVAPCPVRIATAGAAFTSSEREQYL